MLQNQAEEEKIQNANELLLKDSAIAEKENKINQLKKK